MSENEPRKNLPVPASLLMAMIWTFILLFPLLLLLDPGMMADRGVMWNALGMYYVTLLSTMLMFVINQRYFVPKFFFRKKYVKYFVGNSLVLIFVLFQREVVTFLTSRNSGEGFAEFLGSYCFSAARNHFSIWTIITFVIVLSAICFLCIMISMFSRQLIRAFITREKNKASLQYELDFLKNQLSPHFLFNTLNNITSLISFDPKLAESSMAKLSKLLRVMLYQTSDKFIELKDEVDILLKYGELEKLRLSESFDFQFDTKIGNPHCQIPPLLMMPLMENAMKHCVNPNGKSFAHIRITQDDEKIQFRSENSNYPRKPKPGASGLGLATFKKRLELLYDGKCSYNTWTEGNSYICDLVIFLK
ncbi:MAG: histidine kinase [Fibrobacter sp.]|nr:histidine kinase [Fibrobacter sp.]